MARIVRKTMAQVRIMRKVERLALTSDEAAFLTLALLVSRKNSDSVVKLSDIVLSQCDAGGVAKGLAKRGLVHPWRNKQQSGKFTLSEEAEREAIRCLSATAA